MARTILERDEQAILQIVHSHSGGITTQQIANPSVSPTRINASERWLEVSYSPCVPATVRPIRTCRLSSQPGSEPAPLTSQPPPHPIKRIVQPLVDHAGAAAQAADARQVGTQGDDRVAGASSVISQVTVRLLGFAVISIGAAAFISVKPFTPRLHLVGRV